VVVAIGCGAVDGAPTSMDRVGTSQQGLSTGYAAGSLVIPMDTTYQDSGTLKAFGLVYKLLSSNVPVAWVVKTGKLQGGVDFVASGKDLQTGASIANYGYRGGPFVIDSANRAAALPIVQAWQASNTTAVHDMTATFGADVQRTLVAAPRIAVFVDGNEDIAFAYLNAAGVPDSLKNPWPAMKLASYAGHPDVLTEAQVAGPTTGGAYDGVLLNGDGTPAWCQLTSMHYDAPGNQEAIREVRGWLSASPNTHAYMECAAAETFENSLNGRFLTTSGITNQGKGPNPTQDLHPDIPFTQYDGTFTAVGGSVSVINLASQSTLYSSDVTLLNLSGDPATSDVAWMTGHVDGDTTKGKVSYLVGHQYSATLPISKNPRTNGIRLFLDGLFETDCASATSQPTLSLSLSAPGAVTGTRITYTITYANSGPGVANNVTLIDPLPSGTTFVSATNGGGGSGGNVTWSLGNLSVNETGSVSFTVAVAQNGTYADQAKLDYVVGVTPKEQLSNTTSTVVGTGAGSSDLSVSATDSPDPVAPGGTITYAVNVGNAGPDASGAVTVTDSLPAGSSFSGGTGTGWSCAASGGTITCTHAAIAAGGSAPLSIALTAPASTGTVSNTISVTSPTPDPASGNNTVTTTTTVQESADLSVAETASPDPVPAGAPLAYNVKVASAGPNPSGAVTYTDTLPSGAAFVGATGAGWTCSASGQHVTCTHAGLASGEQAPLTLSVAAPSSTGTITNTGTVSSPANDPSPGNNTVTTQTTVGPASADLAVTMTGAPGTVATGGTISYAVGVTNAGPSPSGSVTVSDPLPAGTAFQSATGSGWTCSQAGGTVACTHAALSSGASAPLALNVTAPNAAGTVTNTVTVAGAAGDPSNANNTATTMTTVNPPPDADLSVSMTASPDPVGVGGNVAYALVVQNAGPASSGAITVTDPLPAGASFASATGSGWTCSASGTTVTCTHAVLASGDAAPLTLNLTAPTTPGTITNTVMASSTSPDPSGLNNTATTTTTVTAAAGTGADLSLTVSITPDPVQAGAPATYTVTASNAGPDASGPVTFTDTLPAGATVQTATGDGWTCTPSGGMVTCSHDGIADGASATVTLTIIVPQASGTLTNTATVTSTTADPSDGNNTVVTTTMIGGGTDAAGTCAADGDCGGPSSGLVCDDATMSCASGCRGQGGNGCPAGEVCTSVDTTIGQCATADSGNDAAGNQGGGDGSIDAGPLPDAASSGGGPVPDDGSIEGGGLSCTTAPGRGGDRGIPVFASAVGLALLRVRRRGHRRRRGA
jgi:uncharacterized repeat protein (TIGR01451 family)